MKRDVEEYEQTIRQKIILEEHARLKEREVQKLNSKIKQIKSLKNKLFLDIYIPKSYYLCYKHHLLSMIAPCLRWAGGKRWLVKYIDKLLPPNGFQNYHEPFLGGASMFLSIGLGHTAFLSDLNKDLIETYIAIRDIPNDIISILSTYKNEKDFYYYGQTNEKYKEKSRKSSTAGRKPITYSRASNFGSKNEM
ncbi:MAG: DNA adenine methylase, partial [Alistipes sp.]|nr:DNA adenine methylase [Alistipes sp.]